MTRTEHASRKRRESLRKRRPGLARKIYARDGGRCVYCGAAHAKCFDHVVPRSRGGKDVITNLVLACGRCNSARHDMSLPRWATYAREAFGLTFTPRQIRYRAHRKAP